MASAKKTNTNNTKKTSSNTTTTARRSSRYDNESFKNTNNKTVTHAYGHNKNKNSDKSKKDKIKIDQNTLLLLAIIAFVVVVILLKIMGVLFTILTVVGIALIIVLSCFLKKIRRRKAVRIVTNIFTIILLLCCIAGVCGVVWFAYIVVTEAPEWDTSALNKAETTIFYDSDGVEYAELSTEKRELIDYEDTSENLINAIIATEDSRFFLHNGFDALRFIKASVSQVLGNSDAGGASTLSMQVIKNTYTDESANSLNLAGIKRKFTDIYLSVFKLEKEYSKEEIFEFYINNHFLGSNSYGVEQASQTYFGKSADELTLSEAALIAGLFQAPTSYDPFKYPDAAEERRSEVLNLMYNHGYITKEQRDAANAIPVESLLISDSTSTTQKYQSYVDTVIDELIDKYDIDPYSTSLKVYTNLDSDRQQGLDDIFDGTTYTWATDNVQAGIAAVDVWSGKILAIAGGRNSGARQLNRATTLNNQIGSTAKPLFDYGPGMEYNNFSTYTLFDDSKYYYSNGQEIRDSDRSYMGTITLRTALAQSRNIPALKAFQQVNNSDIYNFVTSLGITPETEEGSTYVNEAHSIGAFNGASPLEMAAAYAAFANGGTYYEPYSVEKIVYRDTGETIEAEVEGVKVMSDSTAYMITYCLQYAVTNGLSSGAAISGVNLAAKTGTTNFTSADVAAHNLPSTAVHDAWIVGYDPDTSVAMWYGYDSISDGYLTATGAVNGRSSLYKAAGSVLFEKTGKDFEVPDSVIKVAVEMGTDPAKLASSSTPSSKITYEYFKVGTEPTETSTTYSKLSNVTNLKASYDSSSGNVTLTWTAASASSDADDSYGDFGYKIYYGSTLIDFTTSTSYTISGLSDPSGTYKVVTTYENYSDIASSGATVTLSVEEDTSDYTANINVTTSYTIGQALSSCLPQSGGTSNGGTVSTSCVDFYKDGVQLTSGYTVTVTTTDSDGDTTFIDTSEAGTYTATFVVTYNGTKYTYTKKITVG